MKIAAFAAARRGMWAPLRWHCIVVHNPSRCNATGREPGPQLNIQHTLSFIVQVDRLQIEYEEKQKRNSAFRWKLVLIFIVLPFFLLHFAAYFAPVEIAKV